MAEVGKAKKIFSVQVFNTESYALRCDFVDDYKMTKLFHLPK